MCVFCMLWSWFWFFGVGIEIIGYETIPDWIMYLAEFPLLISPLFGIFGVIYGIIKGRKKYGKICIILSILGVLTNAVLLGIMFYLGANF